MPSATRKTVSKAKRLSRAPRVFGGDTEMKAAVRSLVLLLVGTALLLALGQSVNAEVTDDAAVQKPAGLDEIVVTARKRAERVQDIPVAVQALSAQELQRQELNSLESVAAYTPQLTVGRVATGSGATLTLRGIG